MISKKEIGTNDNAVTKDSLGCKKYYNGITDFVLYCDTPMTVAIEGDWGSGKTSAMNIMKENIRQRNDREDRPYMIVDYNVWEFSKYGTEKLDATWLNVGLYHVLCKACGRGFEMATFLNKVKINAGNLVTTISGVMGGDASADAVAELVEGIKNKTYSIEKVLKDIKNIASEEKEKGNRIIIFIDDLDRLRPEEAVDFLEYVKLFMDCEGIVFVLAVDFEVVCSGVKAKYGENIKEEKAKQFFDKIIQLPFEVPVIQYDIKEIVRSCVGIDDNKKVERYIEVIEGVLYNNKNPRTIKRAFNMHSLYLNITDQDENSDCVKKINNYEFYLFVIALLQVARNDLYKKMLEMAKKDFLIDNDEMLAHMNAILSDEELTDFTKVLNYYTNVFGRSNNDRFKTFQDKMLNRSKRKLTQDVIRGSIFNDFLGDLGSDEFAEYEIDVSSNTVKFRKDDYYFVIKNHPLNDIAIEVSDNYDLEQLKEKGIRLKEKGITSQNANELGYNHIDQKFIRFNSVISYIERNEGSKKAILDWLRRK